MVRGTKALIVFGLAFALLVPLFAHPALASAYHRSCVLTSEAPVSFVQAISSKDWQCRPGATDAEAPFVWIKIPQADIKTGRATSLVTVAQPIAGITTVVALGDGSYRARYYDSEAMIGQRGPATSIALPLYGARDKPVGAWFEVRQPFARGPATLFTLKGTREILRERDQSLALLGVLTGMMILAAIYSIVMYFALARMFTLYHAAMSALLAVYTFASSSLQLVLLPETSLWARTITSYSSLSLAMAAMGAFAVSFLERNALNRTVRKATSVTCGLLVVNAVAFAIFAPALPFEARFLYHLAYLPAVVSYLAMCINGWQRNSRVIRFVVAAWTVPFLIALEKLLRGLYLYELPFNADYLFYFAIAIEAIVTAIGVAWRVGELRRERDSALERGDRMSSLAVTDGLTGLPNRRDFDVAMFKPGSYLGIIDLDHFKTINDRYGHLIGDDVLRAVAQSIDQSRKDGLIASAWRLGGEEFAVRIEVDDLEEALRLLDRVRHRITVTVRDEVEAISGPVTVSAGLSPVDSSGRQAAYVIADKALYRAKTSGRDRLAYDAAASKFATLKAVPRAVA